MPAQHTRLFHVRKWLGIYIWPICGASYIVSDIYQTKQLEQGKRKSILQVITERGEGINEPAIGDYFQPPETKKE